MPDESKGVVYAALTGNVLVATAKFVAAAFSQSSAMFTEAIHSSADCANQILLLIGNWRSRKAPDRGHPFGYDGEIYFWAFVVAVLVLVLGGLLSVYQGVVEWRHPHAIEAPGWSFVVLALSAAFEGGSLVFGYRASRRVMRRHRGDAKRVSIWRFIDLSKDPNMYASLLEDCAALIGIALATAGVLGSVAFGWLRADALASIAIGGLLIADSYVIANATRSLISGEAVAPSVLRDIEAALDAAGLGRSGGDLQSLHLGPNTILIVLAVDRSEQPGDRPLEARLADIRAHVQAVDRRIRYVFFTLR